MQKQRLEYIDIAKGILICCLLYGHIRVYGPMEGVNDSVMHVMSYTGSLYGCFFMQAFFILTGFCTSFNVNAKTYLWKNIKTLLIPSILLFLFSEYYKEILFLHNVDFEPFNELFNWLTTGGPWFVIAMFWARILWYPINRLRIRLQIIIISLLYLFALVCHYLNVTGKVTIINYQWLEHTFLMLPYLFIGKLWKNNQTIVDKYIKYVAIFGLISIVIQNIISKLGWYELPEHDFAICISPKNFPIHIINSISGTAFVVFISRKISSNKFLQTMGKGTLLIYLWNGLVYRTIVRCCSCFYFPDNILLCSAFHIVTLSICYLVFYLLIKIIYEHKSLNWIVGKW